jgi:hypothetical protein
MATKDELIQGIEVLIREGSRLATDVRPDQWDNIVDLDGWKSKEVLAHVASVGGLVQPMVSGMATAAPGADAMAALNINQLNAAMVGQRAGKTTEELVAELETAYRGVIEFIRTAPDDMLAKTATANGYVDVPVSDLVNRMVVMHGLAHIYSVYSSVFNSKP